MRFHILRDFHCSTHVKLYSSLLLKQEQIQDSASISCEGEKRQKVG